MFRSIVFWGVFLTGTILTILLNYSNLLILKGFQRILPQTQKTKGQKMEKNETQIFIVTINVYLYIK